MGKRADERARMRAKARAAKALRMQTPGEASRYARKRKGEIVPEYDHGQVVLCGACYRAPCHCPGTDCTFGVGGL